MVVSSSYQPRLVDDVLARRVRHHPAVLLVGPRATGKTTTAARLANSVIRLDERAQAVAAEADPDAALRDLPEPVLVDEWQIVPSILGAIKRTVDDDPRPGRFIITGSVRGDVDSPTWPGTGRLIRIAMYGLTVGEIDGVIPARPLLDRLADDGCDALLDTPGTGRDLRAYAELALAGGFPDPVLRLPDSERQVWLDSYVEQLLTRDLAEIDQQRDPQLLRRFLEVYALSTAYITAFQKIQEAAGIARATAQAYAQLLQNLFIIEEMPAWWTNRLKRLTKNPKRYLIDPSLVLTVLRTDLAGLMRDGELLGQIMDTLAVAQLRAQLPACESRPRLFHLRQEKGQREVDVVVEYGGGRVFGLEIKASNAPTRSDAKHLIWLREEMGDRFVGGAVLHSGPRSFMLDDRIAAAPLSVTWS